VYLATLSRRCRSYSYAARSATLVGCRCAAIMRLELRRRRPPGRDSRSHCRQIRASPQPTATVVTNCKKHTQFICVCFQTVSDLCLLSSDKNGPCLFLLSRSKRDCVSDGLDGTEKRGGAHTSRSSTWTLPNQKKPHLVCYGRHLADTTEGHERLAGLTRPHGQFTLCEFIWDFHPNRYAMTA
jgi:hypothetical protein